MEVPHCATLWSGSVFDTTLLTVASLHFAGRICVEGVRARVRQGRGGGGVCCILSRDQPVCPPLLSPDLFVVVAAAALFTHRRSLEPLHYRAETAPEPP